MSMKLAVAAAIVLALGAAPALAQGQNAPKPGNAPKPNMAEVRKVVTTISADKAKVTAYCDIEKLEEQMAAADEKKDTKKVEELDKKSQGLRQKLGPDFDRVMESVQDVDPASKEGKELVAILDPLEKQCGH